MEHTANNPTSKQVIEDLLKPPHLYGVLALLCILATSFYFAMRYFERIETPLPTQVAAASSTIDAFAGISLRARSAIVYDIATGKTLYERNADTTLPLASITKVMLALVVAESMPPETVITIPYDTAPEGTAQRLRQGEQWEVSKVIDFTLVSSSNTGADILADVANEWVKARFVGAPAEGATIWRMNQLAKEIGMTTAQFSNPSGLDISASKSGAYASARDIARLFTYAASSSPHVFSATAENGVLLSDEVGDRAQATNTNEALGDIPGLIMGKTGYTDLAGGNLAVIYDVGLAHPVVAVVLGSTREERFEDMRTLVPASRKAITQQ